MSPKKAKKAKQPSKRKKALLRASLRETLLLALECYPDLKGMLKKDLTVDQMVSDIMTSLKEFSPEKMTGIEKAGVKLGKKIKKIAEKLKI